MRGGGLVLQRVEQGEWLSNAYLIVDEIGGTGVLIDSNGVTDPLCERIELEGTTITHILLTHHHWDHVVGVEQLRERFGVPVFAHELASELLEGKVDETFSDGDVIETGRLAPGKLVHRRIPLEEAGAVLESMDRFGTVGVTVIDRY